ncbi:hypothetical protein AVDCRST_MAG84-1404 [uncultured Microcoleus sp.]|uniref:Uncharacterized protein n=1 Tax=uncultured Microcoleus sp. TaxID=259945 RepID=A0A6J4L3C3_9CYAN|nr:hypothetical protein AVDCRST_MAG84-1404 [uncultured Microcoleus sp.]
MSFSRLKATNQPARSQIFIPPGRQRLYTVVSHQCATD